MALTDGFSGAEIEQGIVASLYAAHALGQEPDHTHLAAELRKTRPLSVIMAERVAPLRAWAAGRTVPPSDVGLAVRAKNGLTYRTEITCVSCLNV